MTGPKCCGYLGSAPHYGVVFKCTERIKSFRDRLLTNSSFDGGVDQYPKIMAHLAYWRKQTRKNVMSEEIEIFVFLEEKPEPRSFKVQEDGFFEDLLRIISPDRHHELRLTVSGDKLPKEKSDRLHGHRGHYVHCHHHSKAGPHHHEHRVEVIVNGKPVEVRYVPREHGTVLARRALEESKNSGQNPDKWQLRDEKGNLLDQTQRVSEYKLTAHSKLFLNLTAGGGGGVA